MSKVLFLGNGINRINNNQSWEYLLNDLIGLTRNTISQKDKPFPLLYEEILMNVLKNPELNENDLLNKVIKSVKNIQNNEYHKKYSQLTNKIITTNYDYKIEENILDMPLKTIPKTNTKERIYSLFRKIEIADNQIWHIHGDARNPNSICLGFEKYGANIQKIRNFIINGDEAK